VADLLLVLGAEINAIVPGLDVKATVLHRIATMGPEAENIVRFLLARGADPSIRDQEYGAMPEDWARYHKREATAKLLSEARGRANS
jgi:Ankyrin repeat